MRPVPEGVHVVEPWRIIPSTCAIDKPHRSNMRWRFVSGDDTAWDEELGLLKFGKGYEKADGSYKTIVTPCVSHHGIVYAADDNGLEKAFNYRLGCAREPTIPGRHEELCMNQEKFVTQNELLREFIDDFRDYLTLRFSDIHDFDEQLIKYALMPHPKRAERVRALRNILDNAELYHKTFTRKVGGKVKKAEIAKFGKATRLVNDLTCEGSLLCGFVADRVKSFMADYTKDKWYQFIKTPDLSTLSDVFDKLVQPTGNLYFPFFSDDSCVSIRCSDGIYMANVDISSCDASHTVHIFDLLRNVTSGDGRLARYVHGAIAQCELPLTLRSGVEKKKVVLQADSPTLYSGSTLTTLINNFANICIAFGIKTSLEERGEVTRAECEEVVRNAASAAGYIVTVDPCTTYHGLQFLKHSPCRSTAGVLTPVLNSGVILRSLGACWGDLPGSKKETFQARADRYNTSQIKCYKHCAEHSILRNLRQRYNCDVAELVDHSWLVRNLTGCSSAIIPSEELAARYSVQAADIDYLADALVSGNVIVNTIASRAIMAKDYGLFDNDLQDSILCGGRSTHV